VISRRKTPDFVQGSRKVTDLSAQSIEHPIGEFGWGENLVVGEIGDAGEHVRIPPAQGEASLLVHGATSFASDASSLTVMGV
jgi:hypothetical protein